MFILTTLIFTYAICTYSTFVFHCTNLAFGCKISISFFFFNHSLGLILVNHRLLKEGTALPSHWLPTNKPYWHTLLCILSQDFTPHSIQKFVISETFFPANHLAWYRQNYNYHNKSKYSPVTERYYLSLIHI